MHLEIQLKGLGRDSYNLIVWWFLWLPHGFSSRSRKHFCNLLRDRAVLSLQASLRMFFLLIQLLVNLDKSFISIRVSLNKIRKWIFAPASAYRFQLKPYYQSDHNFQMKWVYRSLEAVKVGQAPLSLWNQCLKHILLGSWQTGFNLMFRQVTLGKITFPFPSWWFLSLIQSKIFSNNWIYIE